MPLGHDRAAGRVGGQAREAFARGQAVFAPRLQRPDSSWAQQIEAIETEGWQMEHWALSLNTWFVTVAHPVFRRVDD